MLHSVRLVSVFRRRTTGKAATETAAETEARLSGKGRATPKRREAETARKQRLAPPRNRKEAAARQREKVNSSREKMRTALQTGDDRYLPKRDQGPVKRFCRDFVDARRNFASYLLPALVGILVLGFVPGAGGFVVLLWMLTLVMTTLDSVYMTWKLGRELKTRFADQSTRGAKMYALLRSSQLRRLRLPKPQVAVGQPLSTRY
jgi:Protein of unknown function (DUF3043)